MLTERLTDGCHRRINYLRISITDRCNLRCVYCMPGAFAKMPHNEILTYEEILKIVSVGRNLGISKLRITGGEPLARRGWADFLKNISRMDGIHDVSLTTNGVLLEKNIEKIRSAGIKRLNVSLDTLRPEKFQKIAGFDLFHRVWGGIMAAHEAGVYPLKVNVVALKGINDDELNDFAQLTFKYPFHIRFIEYMPMGKNPLDDPSGLLTSDIEKILGRTGTLVPLEREANDGPARRFKFQGALGEIGFISPVSRHFCDTCNRLRLTASGGLRPCLLSEKQTDLKGPIRSGASDKEIEDLFIHTVNEKPMSHHLGQREKNGSALSQMSSIGG